MAESLDPGRNITVVVSTGQKCFWCKVLIPKRLKCVSVTFEIKTLLKDFDWTEYAHWQCADGAGDGMKRAAREAAGL